jgi:hypothetical protein
MNVLDLIGAWQLVEFKMRNRDGDINDMQGWIKRGLIIYSTDGHMSATLCMSEQPLRFQSDQPSTGTDAEKIAAFNAYTAYCGRYSVKDDTIFHDVEICLYPNWSGTRQIRTARLSGDELVLTSPEMKVGESEWILEAKWRRVSDYA